MSQRMRLRDLDALGVTVDCRSARRWLAWQLLRNVWIGAAPSRRSHRLAGCGDVTGRAIRREREAAVPATGWDTRIDPLQRWDRRPATRFGHIPR